MAIIVPGMAVSVRRLHDTGRSGWWFFAPFILAVVLMVVSIFAAYIFLTSMFGQTNFSNESLELLFLVLPVLLGVFVISQIVLVVFFVFDSQPGDNKYGPNPKGVPANTPTAVATAPTAAAPTEPTAEIQQEPPTETNQ